MTQALTDTILVVAVFIAILFCQVMSLRCKTKYNYKNSVFWDVNALLLAVNQEWIILGVDWYTTVIKGVLVGINGLGFICVVISMVNSLDNRLEDVPVIEPCETADDVIKREG